VHAEDTSRPLAPLASFLRVIRRVSLASLSFVCVSLAPLASFSGVWCVSRFARFFFGVWCVSLASFSVCGVFRSLRSLLFQVYSVVGSLRSLLFWCVSLAPLASFQVYGVVGSARFFFGVFRSLRSLLFQVYGVVGSLASFSGVWCVLFASFSVCVGLGLCVWPFDT